MPKGLGSNIQGEGGNRGVVSEKVPECYGHQILRGIDDRCGDCEWRESCPYYTTTNLSNRSRRIHFKNYVERPYEQVSGTDVQKAMEDAYMARKPFFVMPGGKKIDVSGINIDLMKICVWLTLEFPETMRAFILKFDPNIRSLDDIAAVWGTSRQLIHKHISCECGVGSKPQRRKKLMTIVRKPVHIDDNQMLFDFFTQDATENK
ncbi:MAG: hypothetical protein II894_05780 [Bacteroidales bacterium]|nr:hypothetical protein [Bacteroidales bacterium]